MGCDIHIAIEYKKDGKWIESELKPDRLLPDGRDYRVFSFLFDVRNEYDTEKEKPFARRGIPQDTCFLEYLENDGLYHSETHLYASEVENIRWPDELKNCYFRIFIEYILPQLGEDYGTKKQDIRMVIGFDS